MSSIHSTSPYRHLTSKAHCNVGLQAVCLECEEPTAMIEMPEPSGPGMQTNPMKRKQTRCPKQRMLNINRFIDWFYTLSFAESSTSPQAESLAHHSKMHHARWKAVAAASMHSKKPLALPKASARPPCSAKRRRYEAGSLEAPESRQG